MVESYFWGGVIFWIGIIASIVLYVYKRKWYPIMYLVSVSSYIFLIIFVIDAFDLSKNWILLVLVVSTVLMILIGLYLSKKILKKKNGKSR